MVEYARVFAPLPTATHLDNAALYATPLTLVNIDVLFVTPVQSMPLAEYAMLFVPLPPATHRDNSTLYATHNPATVKIDAPCPDQVMPSKECAMVSVPLPTLTHLAGSGEANAIPLLWIPSPPYNVNMVPPIVAVVNFVYVLFVSRL